MQIAILGPLAVTGEAGGPVEVAGQRLRTLLAGLQLDMPANTKTYWRVPGETGIPSEFDFSASVGLTSGTIDWPRSATWWLSWTRL